MKRIEKPDPPEKSKSDKVASKSDEQLKRDSVAYHKEIDGTSKDVELAAAVGAISRTTAELAAEQFAANIELEEFNPAVVNLDALIFVIGKRRFGKTVWTRWLLSHMWPYFREVYCFTTTKHNLFWNQHIPESCIYEGLQWNIVHDILSRQQEITKVMTSEGPDSKIVPHVCIVFEDVGSLRSDMRYSEDIAKLAFMGRHFNIFMIFMVQDMKSINADVRANADFVALTYQTQARTMEAAQDDWGDWWSNKWVFRELIRKYCQDHGMLVIAQPKAVYKPEDALFWSRASPPEDMKPFRLGHWQQWAYAECVWEEQLEEAARLIALQQQKKIDHLERALVHLEEGEELRKRKEHIEDDSSAWSVNQIGAAPDAVRQAHRTEMSKIYTKESNISYSQRYYGGAVAFKRAPQVRKTWNNF